MNQSVEHSERSHLVRVDGCADAGGEVVEEEGLVAGPRHQVRGQLLQHVALVGLRRVLGTNIVMVIVIVIVITFQSASLFLPEVSLLGRFIISVFFCSHRSSVSRLTASTMNLSNMSGLEASSSFRSSTVDAFFPYTQFPINCIDIMH